MTLRNRIARLEGQRPDQGEPLALDLPADLRAIVAAADLAGGRT